MSHETFLLVFDWLSQLLFFAKICAKDFRKRFFGNALKHSYQQNKKHFLPINICNLLK
jgi:hypothetical protein